MHAHTLLPLGCCCCNICRLHVWLPDKVLKQGCTAIEQYVLRRPAATAGGRLAVGVLRPQQDTGLPLLWQPGDALQASCQL